MSRREVCYLPDAARPEPDDLVRHWKHGRLYKVDRLSKFQTPPLLGVTVVTYRPVDPDDPDEGAYTRTIEDFTCQVKDDNGSWVRRFAPVARAG